MIWKIMSNVDKDLTSICAMQVMLGMRTITVSYHNSDRPGKYLSDKQSVDRESDSPHLASPK